MLFQGFVFFVVFFFFVFSEAVFLYYYFSYLYIVIIFNQIVIRNVEILKANCSICCSLVDIGITTKFLFISIFMFFVDTLQNILIK